MSFSPQPLHRFTTCLALSLPWSPQLLRKFTSLQAYCRGRLLSSYASGQVCLHSVMRGYGRLHHDRPSEEGEVGGKRAAAPSPEGSRMSIGTRIGKTIAPQNFDALCPPSPFPPGRRALGSAQGRERANPVATTTAKFHNIVYVPPPRTSQLLRNFTSCRMFRPARSS